MKHGRLRVKDNIDGIDSVCNVFVNWILKHFVEEYYPWQQIIGCLTSVEGQRDQTYVQQAANQVCQDDE